MLSLFRKCPHYNGPEWHKVNDTHKIEWQKFRSFLLLETYFMEDWRYELLRRFAPSIYQKIRSEHYRKICNRRMATINRYIEKAEKFSLLKVITTTPYAPKVDSDLKLTSNGIDFLINPSDFIKVVLTEYNLVTSFLMGIIPPTIIWIATILPRLLIEYKIL